MTIKRSKNYNGKNEKTKLLCFFFLKFYTLEDTVVFAFNPFCKICSFYKYYTHELFGSEYILEPLTPDVISGDENKNKNKKTTNK